MEIAFVHPLMIEPGGAEYLTKWLSEELVRRRHRVSIYTLGYDVKKFGPVTDGVNVKYLTPLRLSKVSSRTAFSKWLMISRNLASQLTCYDLVIAHNFPAYVWCVWARRFRCNIPPVVWLCEEPPRFLYRRYTDPHYSLQFPLNTLRAFKACVMDAFRLFVGRIPSYLLRVFDVLSVSRLKAIIANSKFTAENVRMIYRRRAWVCHLGIPICQCRYRDKADRDPVRNEFLYVGRLSRHKNVHNLITGFALSGLANSWHLRLVGTNDVRWTPTLRRLAQNLGLTDRVLFAGSLSRDDLCKAYEQCYGVVYVPLDESFGLVPLEAGVHGKAVIASDHGGPSEVMVDSRNGLQVNPLSVDDIGRALRELATDPERASQIGARWQETVLSYFTIEKFADRFLETLKVIMERDIN